MFPCRLCVAYERNPLLQEQKIVRQELANGAESFFRRVIQSLQSVQIYRLSKELTSLVRA